MAGKQWSAAYIPIERLVDDNAPSGRKRGAPRSLDWSAGSPFEDQPEPSRVPRADHFERVELARGTNRDGVVRIAQPATNKTARAKTPKPAKAAKSARRATIRVIPAY